MSGQLAHKARLPDSRLAAHQQSLAISRGRLAPKRARLAELLLSTHETATHDTIENQDFFLALRFWVEQVIALQIFVDLVRGWRAILRILAHQLHDQRVKHRWDLRVLGPWRYDGGVNVLRDDRQRVAGRKWKVAGRELIKHDAQGVEVGPAIEVLPERQFRSQVEDSSDDLALGRHARGHRTCEAEVHQLGCAIRFDQHVLGLEIAVHDPVRVRMIQRQTHLLCDREDAP